MKPLDEPTVHYVSKKKLFFIEVLAVLDALPNKRLARRYYMDDYGEKHCAIGAWMRSKGATTTSEGWDRLGEHPCAHYYFVDVTKANDRVWFGARRRYRKV